MRITILTCSCLFVLLASVVGSEALAQSIRMIRIAHDARHASHDALDPYRRINDPFAIADLGGPDSGSSIHAYSVRANWGPYDTDGYTIQAEDTGVGILRHLWAVYGGGAIPDTDSMKLWVDDSLLIDGSVREFFTSRHGLIGPPFDTASGGAEVCEAQIPFHRNFRWTHLGEWHWYGAEWQRIDTTKTILPNLGSSTFATDQAAADTNYWTVQRSQQGSQLNIDQHISPEDTMIVANLQGPAYLERIHLLFPEQDKVALDRLWIMIHWDYSPEPSVSMPLSDLFGLAMGPRNIHAMFIAVDSANGTLDLTFPMPFKVNARIAIVNQSGNTVRIQGVISYKDTGWHSSWGYFATQYHVTPEISYHLLHPALHAKGRGRFIGVILNFPTAFMWPSYLEGDAYVKVDSLPYLVPGISLHYGGIEDYCDAGWYFHNTTDTVSGPSFSLPFRGCPIWPSTVYRFYVNDPYNYSQSIDVDFGHGFYDDYTTTYRSVAFYYKAWTPFYPSSDTIIAGNTWTVTGAGFASDTALIVRLDSDTIYEGVAAADGSLAIKLLVPTAWAIGDHVLSINGIEKPERITVLAAPKLLYIQDSAGRTFSEGDSIEIRAYGFMPGERITLLLGDSLFPRTPGVIADSDGVVRLKRFLPWVPQGRFYMKMLRGSGAVVISDSSLFVTRTLNYEFELLPLVESNGLAGYSYLSYAEKHWSQGAIEFCNGNYTRGTAFAFQFVVPFADTFSTTVFGTIGNRYGIYRTFIDATDLGLHDWFLHVPWGPVYRDSTILPNIYLAAGLHTIRFVNEGWDDSAVEYSIAPDNLTLAPLSAYGGYSAVKAASTFSDLSVFPNPLDQDMFSIAGIPDSFGSIPLVLYNEIGQVIVKTVAAQQTPIRTVFLPPLANGSYWLAVELPSDTKIVPLQILR